MSDYTTLLQIGFLAQIILQLGCSLEAYAIFKKTNHGNRFWILSIGFFLMAVRRVTAMLSANGEGLTFLETLDKIGLPLVISICLFIGLKFLYRNVQVSQENHLKRLEELTNQLTSKK